jgi:hypothetical protein
MELPTTWTALDGSPMVRTAAQDDTAWRALIESQGWTPGATGAGTAPGATPAQIMAMITAGIAAGMQVVSGIHGMVTAADPATGTVTDAAGNVIPVGDLGVVTSGGTSLNSGASSPAETIIGPITPMMMIMIGGAALVLLMTLKK